jgi:antitoxin MazE
MRSRVQKWGNSLALRIPKSFADEMGLEKNSSVELMLKEGTLVVSPAAEQRWSLEELLAGVTEENIHHEWETSSEEGEEIW